MERYMVKVKLQKRPELHSDKPVFQIENDCHDEWITVKTQDVLQCLVQILELANYLDRENNKLRDLLSAQNQRISS
jgi:hypothetical protein